MDTTQPSTWTIDPGHSAIQFRVRHLGIATVVGAFDTFTGTVQTNRDDFAGAQVTLAIPAASLNTKNAQRDAHLKSDAFFDAAQFPQLAFSGTLHPAADAYVLAGQLTLHGVTQLVELPAACTGVGTGRFDDLRAGFTAQGSLNRTAFGLTWNMLTAAGNLLIGEDIAIQLDVELLKVGTGPQ